MHLITTLDIMVNRFIINEIFVVYMAVCTGFIQ